MKWKKYTIRTTTGAEDILSAELGSLGIEGVEIKDAVPVLDGETRGMFVDVMPDLPPDNGKAEVSFYLDPETEPEKTLAAVRSMLQEISAYTDLGEASIAESETADEDWINNWKRFFHPFAVDDILIKPTWEPMPASAAGKTLIQIDPGTAFGTGSHETTQLCIRQLEKYLKIMRAAGAADNIRVLDVGTGSGILGIIALKLGASHVFATDLDENAMTAVGENLACNGIAPEDFEVVCGNIIDDRAVQEQAGDECYDIAVANILANVIMILQKEVFRHLKHGGLFISSGIIDTKEQDVRAAIEANPELEIIETNHQGEWVNITARRK